jgi:hypothetical protein
VHCSYVLCPRPSPRLFSHSIPSQFHHNPMSLPTPINHAQFVTAATRAVADLASKESFFASLTRALTAQILLLLFLSRFHMSRLMRLLISFTLFTVLPGAYEALQVRIGTDPSTKVRTTQVGMRQDSANPQASRQQPTILRDLTRIAKEAPEVMRDMIAIARAYWALGTRLLRIFKTLSPVLVQSGKNWSDVLANTRKLFTLWSNMTKKK